MEGKTIAIIALSVGLASALVFGGIMFAQNRKLKAKAADKAAMLADYIATLPIYQTSAEAKTNGLSVGDHYRKSATATDFEVVTA